MFGRATLRALADAYEQERRDGLLPATYEVVYGHAWRSKAGAASPAKCTAFPSSA